MKYALNSIIVLFFFSYCSDNMSHRGEANLKLSGVDRALENEGKWRMFCIHCDKRCYFYKDVGLKDTPYFGSLQLRTKEIRRTKIQLRFTITFILRIVLFVMLQKFIQKVIWQLLCFLIL